MDAIITEGAMHRIFLLSPASAAGARMKMLLRSGADFELARAVQSRGAPLGDVFSFASGLYFRGKQSYARRFGSPPPGEAPGLVIAPGRGLVALDVIVTAADIREMGAVPIDLGEPRYRVPLSHDAHALCERLGPSDQVVLLGSVASAKYTAILLDVFGDRLLFPSEFVGRGDMSRGGLLLRSVADGTELEYLPVRGATLRGARPPKLPKLRGVLARANAALVERAKRRD
jgi:hypothetical protein